MNSKVGEKVFQDEESFYIPLPNSNRAFLKYYIEKGKMYILSTYTPPEYRGVGLASKLMEEAVKFASKNNLKIVPLCSYAKHYMDEHTELRSIVDRHNQTF
ncbi:MAG: GNAT family N-acetyltransferase [Nitrososphaerota archaeon]|nr:GNAT family N-acetyltransferase [Nitrososphaerota archaeon]